MNINISGNKNIFILGAGASAEYGFPLWKDLNVLIKKELDNEDSNYNYKKEILEWLEKVKNGTYNTIDKCISIESISDNYRNTGDDIEKEIWHIIKKVFDSISILDQDILDKTWLSDFNTYILRNSDKFLLDDGVFFINYNYDSVLPKYFCKQDIISKKEKNMRLKNRVGKMNSYKATCLCPHGSFLNNGSAHGNINIVYETLKTKNAGAYGTMDIVSCYDAEEITLTRNYKHDTKLFIIGLGGGLTYNLSKIELPESNIQEIHITVSRKRDVKNVKDFLSKKFSIDPDSILIYKNSKELVQIFK